MTSHAHPFVAIALMASIGLAANTSAGVPADNAFNYQGRLALNGDPVDEICQMTVSLWDTESGGVQHGATLILNDVPIDDGVFNILLDFGTDAIVNGGRYLDITIDCPTGGAANLAPRQRLDPTLFSVMANSAIGQFQVFEETTRQPLVTIETDVYKGSPYAAVVLQSPGSAITTEVADDGFFMFEETGPDTDICYLELNAQTGLGGMLRLNRGNGSPAFSADGSGSRLNAQNGSFRVEHGIIDSANGDGFINVRDSSGSLATWIIGNSINTTDLFVSGAKFFRVPNPDDANTELYYACPEGPEAAAYVRGTATLVDGKATITFPQHFRSVTNHETMTVNLTPRSAMSMGLAVVERSKDGFIVQELANGNGSYEFDYYVMAVRAGHEDFEVIRPRETK